MNKLSKTLLAIMLILGLIAAFLPNIKPHYKLLNSHQLLYEINKNHYFTTDQVAKAIMTKDPSLLLIDVRKSEDYKNYTLPGALNIPVDSILNDKYQAYFKSGAYNVVLFSNGNTLAEKAWILLKSLGYENIFVLKGGINQWFTTIIRPSKPDDWEDQNEFDKYEFRKVASNFFTGADNSNEETETSTENLQIPVANLSNSNDEPSGGCE